MRSYKDTKKVNQRRLINAPFGGEVRKANQNQEYLNHSPRVEIISYRGIL